jgi:hypothetical protein
MAEAAAAKAEEVAAAAMKAAEAAVKDEMQAAAVVKETQTALEKTLSALKDLGDKKPSESAAAAVAGGGASGAAPSASTPAGTAAAAAAGAAAAAVVGAKEVSAAAPSGAAAAPAKMMPIGSVPGVAAASVQLVEPANLYPSSKGQPVNWVKIGAAALGVVAGYYFFNSTDPGRAVVAAATSLVSFIKVGGRDGRAAPLTCLMCRRLY